MTERATQTEAIVDPATHGLDVYAVGGAIRDALLGLPVQDRDYVVVGATPEAMEARGFRAVGKDFPVFLHPVTQAEYASPTPSARLPPATRASRSTTRLTSRSKTTLSAAT